MTVIAMTSNRARPFILFNTYFYDRQAPKHQCGLTDQMPTRVSPKSSYTWQYLPYSAQTRKTESYTPFFGRGKLKSGCFIFTNTQKMQVEWRPLPYMRDGMHIGTNHIRTPHTRTFNHDFKASACCVFDHRSYDVQTSERNVFVLLKHWLDCKCLVTRISSRKWPTRITSNISALAVLSDGVVVLVNDRGDVTALDGNFNGGWRCSMHTGILPSGILPSGIRAKIIQTGSKCVTVQIEPTDITIKIRSFDSDVVAELNHRAAWLLAGYFVGSPALSFHLT